MRIVPVSAAAIDQALSILRSGGIVAHATETCYGLACDLGNPTAVKKLFRMKQRSEDQPVSALFSSITEAKRFVEWSSKAQELGKKFLPGPLTLILPLRKDRPSDLFVVAQSPSFKAHRSIGVRISSHPLAAELVTRFGKPLSTTSANIHGLPNTYSAEEIVVQLQGQEVQPDLIIDSGSLPKLPSSSVIDLTGTTPGLLRKGEISPR